MTFWPDTFWRFNLVQVTRGYLPSLVVPSLTPNTQHPPFTPLHPHCCSSLSSGIGATQASNGHNGNPQSFLVPVLPVLPPIWSDASFVSVWPPCQSRHLYISPSHIVNSHNFWYPRDPLRNDDTSSIHQVVPLVTQLPVHLAYYQVPSLHAHLELQGISYIQSYHIGHIHHTLYYTKDLHSADLPARWPRPRWSLLEQGSSSLSKHHLGSLTDWPDLDLDLVPLIEPPFRKQKVLCHAPLKTPGFPHSTLFAHNTHGGEIRP